MDLSDISKVIEVDDIFTLCLDVHKKSIDVAITDQRANSKVRSYGKIDGTLEA